MLWPNLTTNNPLCSLNTAHNQPLCEHWFGDKPIDESYGWAARHEQVIHAEPMPETMPACRSYPSIFIHAHDDQGIKQTAQLTKAKLPQFYGHYTLQEVEELLKERNDLFLEGYMDLTDTLYFTFQEFSQGDIATVLDRIHQWLSVPPGRHHDTIVSIHQRWRSGNQHIWETA